MFCDLDSFLVLTVGILSEHFGESTLVDDVQIAVSARSNGGGSRNGVEKTDLEFCDNNVLKSSAEIGISERYDENKEEA